MSDNELETHYRTTGTIDEAGRVNPYITRRVESYRTLRNQIDGLQTRAVDENRDLTEAELNSVKAKAAEAKAIYTEIAPEIEEHHRHGQVAAMQAQIQPALAEQDAPSPDAVPPLLPSGALLRAAHACFNEGRTAARFTVGEAPPGQQHRAAVTTAQAGVPTGQLERTPREPRRLAVVAGLPSQTIAWGSDVVFPVWTGGAANVVAEGVLKPEMTNPAAGSVVPSTIAIWQDVTRQADSLGNFRARLEQKLAAKVALREDQLLVSTAIGTVGRQTYVAPVSEPFADSLLHAAALVLGSDVAAPPNVAVVNVADVKKIFGGGVGAGGESPESMLRLDLHGMTIYPVPTAALAVNKAVVGAWSAMARLIVGLAPTLLVDAVSGMKNNLITVLLEEALGLAIDEPTGLVEVTFG